MPLSNIGNAEVRRRARPSRDAESRTRPRGDPAGLRTGVAASPTSPSRTGGPSRRSSTPASSRTWGSAPTGARTSCRWPTCASGEDLFLHGSVASRLVRALSAGTPVCVTVTVLDGIVLARSAFNTSMNYRSAMVMGETEAVTDERERLRVLAALLDRLVPGRSAARPRPEPRGAAPDARRPPPDRRLVGEGELRGRPATTPATSRSRCGRARSHSGSSPAPLSRPRAWPPTSPGPRPTRSRGPGPGRSGDR